MTKFESNRASAIQLNLWKDRNRKPDTLPCVPVILINSLTGEKTGLAINIAHGMSLENTLKLLKVATEQVSKQMEVEGN